MDYQFRFAPYHRPFKTPLQTHHGLWTMRAGIILSLRDDAGRISRGEIAPLPWFGTETLEQAIAFCTSFGGKITTEQIAAIPDNLPACQFGFESASINLANPKMVVSLPPTKFCQLVRRSPNLLQDLETLLQKGYRTFKLKIALDTPATEMALCQQILANLPVGGRLRLDANGGFSSDQAKHWLDWGETQAKLEFIEQPLPPEHFSALLQLDAEFQTPIALDESVSQLASLETCVAQGWCGVFVIKLAIAGFPSRLKAFCQTQKLDVVISTVFETAVGQRAILNFAQNDEQFPRALGMGGSQWI